MGTTTRLRNFEQRIYIYSGVQASMMEYECLKHVQWQLYKNLTKLNKKDLTWDICSKVGHLYYKAVANGSGNIDTIVENSGGARGGQLFQPGL